MARGRMLSKSLSTSKRFAMVAREAGDLGEFCQLLYPLIVSHADDFGRLAGDPFTVKMVVLPTSPRSEAEFGAALSHLDAVGLISWYTVDGEQFIHVVKFDAHQEGLHKRTKSKLPPPPESQPFSASERDIEAVIARDLASGALTVGDHRIRSVNRQVRRGSQYIDIVALGSSGRIVVEVKRHKVTKAAIEQVLGYCDLLDDVTVAVVIGCGFDPDVVNDTRVVIGDYQEGEIRHVSGDPVLLHVPEHSGTSPTAPLSSGLIEQKGTEQKGRESTERQIARARAELPTNDPDIAARAGRFIDRFTALYRQERHGAHYMGRPAHDWPRACDIVSTWTDDAYLDELVICFLNSDEPFIARSNRGIPVFAAKASWCDDQLRQAKRRAS